MKYDSHFSRIEHSLDKDGSFGKN